MNKKYLTFILLLLLPLFMSCEREVTIVEFDDTYKIDEKYVAIDIPEKLNYNPNNIISYSGATEIVLSYRQEEDNSVVMNNKKIPIRIKLKKPLTESVNIIFTEEQSLLDNYEGIQLGYEQFPEGTFANAEIAIPKGETTVEGWIELQNTEAFSKPGYLAGLKMSLQKEIDNTVVSKVNHVLFIKVNKSGLKDEDNIEFVQNRPSGLKEIAKSEIELTSNYAKDHLYKLLDGAYWTNWWIPSNSSEDLILSIPKAKVGVVHLSVGGYWDSTKLLKSVKVAISEDGSAYFEQGSVSIPNNTKEVYIKFNNPHEINYIRLYDFIGVTDVVDINQLSVLIIE